MFLFTSTDCPISNRYAPEVRRLEELFGPKGVAFRLVYPNPAEPAAAIREHMSAFAYGEAAVALRDPAHALVKFVHATVTPEAAVYAGGRVVYRGRIDDRHVDLGVDRPAATTRDLADALSAVSREAGGAADDEGGRLLHCGFRAIRRARWRVREDDVLRRRA